MLQSRLPLALSTSLIPDSALSNLLLSKSLGILASMLHPLYKDTLLDPQCLSEFEVRLGSKEKNQEKKTKQRKKKGKVFVKIGSGKIHGLLHFLR